MKCTNFRYNRAFTLIELLVVISIIAVLMAIMMPALGRAREQAKKVICVSNNHQWAIATVSYAADWNERFPQVSDVQQPAGIKFFRNVISYASVEAVNGHSYDLVSTFVSPYVGEPKFMECPSRQGDLYGNKTWQQVWDDAESGANNGYINGDYAYFAGNDYNESALASHIELEDESVYLPLRISNARSSMCVVGDVVLNTRTYWRYSHPWQEGISEDTPKGMCGGFVDGSANWIDFEDMDILFEYNHTRTEFYWPVP